MRVLYDLQTFQWTRYSGIPRYFIELIKQFTSDNSIDVILPCSYCMNRGYQNIFPDKCQSLNWKLRDWIIDSSLKIIHKNPAKYISSVEKKSVNEIINGNYDLFHPTFFNTYFLKHINKKPFVLTIHDLSLEFYPELSSINNKTPYDTSIVIKKASHFIADSKFTKKHFIEYYDIDADLVDVVYLGPTFNKIKSDTNERTIKSPKKYLLFVNNRFGRKNFYTLVGAIKNILIDYDLNLICAGGGTFTKDELEFFKMYGISDRVIFVNADDNKLIELYCKALAFVFPSIYEGFGIPILEAFACGCPVVLSNASCLPEVGGDAAVYFDPKDIVSMREAVYTVISDEKLRDKMRDVGYKQLEKFSWEKCARETKMVYEKVLE